MKMLKVLKIWPYRLVQNDLRLYISNAKENLDITAGTNLILGFIYLIPRKFGHNSWDKFDLGLYIPNVMESLDITAGTNLTFIYLKPMKI